MEFVNFFQEFSKNNSVLIPHVFYTIGANLFLLIYSNTKFLTRDLKKNLLDTLVPTALALDPTGGVLNMTPWVRHIAPDSCGYTDVVNGLRDGRKFILVCTFKILSNRIEFSIKFLKTVMHKL